MQTSSSKGRTIIRDSWMDTVWIGGPGVVLFLLLRQFFPINVVPTPSMEPTIKTGERVLVNKFSQRPQRGDLVQLDSGFRYGLGEREPVKFIKRVVGLPGDTVAIESGRLVVNGVVIEEDYATAATEDYAMVKVPADHYFVLGDNREKSYDSRFLGAIEADQIEGQVILIF